MVDCQCLRCVAETGETKDINGMAIPVGMLRMFVCAICGNKRCPHSDDHRNACAASNEPGQPGSRYG
jgi:hypothetical protein